MNTLATLSSSQYELILNVLNLSIAVLGGSSLLFMLLRRNVAQNYSISVAMMAAVTGMAGYHYFRIYQSWIAAFAQQGSQYVPTGAVFSYTYRYADWMGTVPLLLAAVMLVLDLGRKKSASLVTRMVVAALLMIVLGFVGENQTGNLLGRAVWGALSMVPFFYILYVLWTEMGQVLLFESDRVRELFSTLRLVLLVSWSFYPLVYCIPLLGLKSAGIFSIVQVANSAADLLAKVGVGLFILAIAREKTEEDLAAGQATGQMANAFPAGAAAD